MKAARQEEMLQSMESETHALEKIVAETQQENDKLGLQLLNLGDQNAILEDLVASQSCSPADREVILAEIAELRITCETLEKQREELQNTLYQDKLERSRQRREILEGVSKYNTQLMVYSGELSLSDLEIKIENTPEEEWAAHFTSIFEKFEDLHGGIRKRDQELKKKKSSIEIENRKLNLVLHFEMHPSGTLL